MNCLICDKPFEFLNNLVGSEQIHGGLIFTHSGSFGSTVWDNFSSEFLLFAICDNCLVERKKNIRVRIRAKQVIERLEKDEPWNPPSGMTEP